MKLDEKIIKDICKELEKGKYAKSAALGCGITERTYYRWKEDGEEILRSISDKDGVIDKDKYNKLEKTLKLKCQFCQSIAESEAKGENTLVGYIFDAAKKDWKAAMQLLARKFPDRWANKDFLKLEGEIENKPNKLKELEDEFFSDIPEEKMKDVAKEIQGVIKNASNGKLPKEG